MQELKNKSGAMNLGGHPLFDVEELQRQLREMDALLAETTNAAERMELLRETALIRQQVLNSRHDDKFGTVGAVALDKKGNLAAATSTGGMMNKKYGRIGDAPIIGAGTYANT